MENPILLIAKKEFLDNIRNKWIIVVSILIIALTLLSSFAGSYWKSFDGTVIGMIATVQFFIPLIGLMLGYASIIGEVEKGSMNSLLAHPVTRFEIIMGKLFGNGLILALSIIIGFGIGGIIVAFNVSDVNLIGYLIFIGATILIGIIYFNISMLYSTVLKRRTLAMGVSILTYFFFLIIYPMILSMIWFATSPDQFSPGVTPEIPDWYFGASIANPMTSYSDFISMNLFETNIYPSFYNSNLLLIVLMLWLIIPLILSYLFFKRKDI